MAKDRTFHIRPALDGQTLAAGLRRLVPALSWAEARQLIAGRRVQVNGNLALDEARRLKAGDVVKLFEHARAPVPTERDVRVRHIDSDLIVVEKPAGITTLRHAEERDWPAQRKQRQPTLDEALQRMLPGLMREAGLIRADRPGGSRGHPLEKDRRRSRPAPSSRKGAPPPVPPKSVKLPRVRPVHRLDRDTSGLMLFALSPRAESALVEMFKSHEIGRAYLAVVHGRLDEPRTIESWFVRDRGDGLRGSTPLGADAEGAQRAVTHVRPVEHVGGEYTVVECRLETGRTHQIRIHLAEVGHMLCGEKVYTRPSAGAQPTPDRSGAPRQALHSAELRFTHPVGGQELRFASPLPKDLSQWLHKLKEMPRKESGDRVP
jgi:23S rRNA pseudouridine1911/1915/1917 synthase